MAKAPYVRTQTWPGIENLPLESMKPGMLYTLQDIDESQHQQVVEAGNAEAAKRDNVRFHCYPKTSYFSREYTYGFIKNREVVVVPPGMESMMHRARGAAGRPLGPTGEAVQSLLIDDHVFILRDGRTQQTIRNTVSRIAKRLNRKFRTELYEHGDVIKVTRTA